MWAPTESRTTSGARYCAAVSAADASPVRRAFRYASAARTRGCIGPFLDPRRQAFRGHVFLLGDLPDDKVERPAAAAVGLLLDLDLELLHIEVVVNARLVV